MKHNPQANQIWETAAVTGGTTSQQNAYSSWPLFTFIGLLFGGPYLISKFFSSNTSNKKIWDLKKGTFYKAKFSHEAASETELGFCENEIVKIAPPEFQLYNGSGWLLASNQQGKVGYVPVNRLNVPMRHNMKENEANEPFK